MTTLAILTAAGSGTRLGFDLPKALVPLRGLPLVLHAARRLTASGVVDALVVTAPNGLVSVMSDVLEHDPHVSVPVVVVAGGTTRQSSVAAGLTRARADIDTVVVHDAARPLAPAAMIRRVVETVKAGHQAVIPGLAVTDTVKILAPRGPAEGSTLPAGVDRVAATPARTLLRAVQTPQAFDRALLVRAHAAGAARARTEATAATDDASLVEALGEDVFVVEGDELAMKVTTARDFYYIEKLLTEDVR
ncbi:2-C-methyl-D-erythritol 4-phosphate cytidylyltransferase [Oerskovia turbata]|uniref:2-C-methyl-D-erythritol 4-phosphate cytidylyltransferase n=1 Tax=Oerskovia turbata TaxID=1713 RepID=A0A4Q1L1R2_9CELL|nr:2-C-methyl-D-erythritol 4-phosphate cytidylyltransferase [Oerskovia turbata]RXR26974.1 2-C-methyl-D-erythritol 4-phosphate cytidylyltransferase [Oerskovia turbata]RXR36183.1 2-C-methyl-D-erythritol 4-phosphate cytidylyltransferase [Oerskovia turbata]